MAHIIFLYGDAEATGAWPLQALQAVLGALEKGPDDTNRYEKKIIYIYIYMCVEGSANHPAGILHRDPT